MRSPSSIAFAVAVVALGCVASVYAEDDFNGPSFRSGSQGSGVQVAGARRLLQTASYPPPPYGAYPPPPYGAYPPPYGAYPPPPPGLAPLPEGGLAAAPKTAGSTLFTPVSVTFVLSAAGCVNAGANPNEFSFMFAESVVMGWNATSLCAALGFCELPGDISDIELGGACFLSAAARRRALLQSASATVSARNNIPPGVTAEQADANAVAFKAAMETAMETGNFANSFGIESATAVVSSAASSESSSNSLALGLGLGLGIGIPLIAAIIAAVIIIQKRRKNQSVGQSSTPAHETAA